ncbi:DUF2939 domain-containing protein [Pandoraea sputorum]|uniref:Protein of uncharacterized function (DUF2939) n=1 Tax=Pandoraea sputorum TaxID=93222 RepID=A0A239SI43_9BURK|nr:DUF2939 domain-containing protein [Pandoraea sputorum]APD12399.1 hypothetical protein NA29_25440 [Pandoraea sputorum]BET10345.1 DUF2939 domain-containing protein [Pandoraea sputorum]SNU84353.1 Protein of uncharacterised function (DUF2939) [Pandoraea sputorum]VVD89598.1 hypothetical protein PSP20601_01544 [Pandoraea sputorum]
MRKLSLVVVALLVVLGLLFGTPYYTLWRARDAANARDATTLSSYVDYPAVRESLKLSLHDELSRQMDKQRSNAFGALALALGGWVSDRVVEALLTPEAVAAMLRGDSTGLPPVPGAPAPRDVVPPQAESSAPQAAPVTPPTNGGANASDAPATPENQPPRTTTRTEFQDFNHFLVHVSRSDRPERVVTFTLTRRNVVQWRLTAIALPPL